MTKLLHTLWESLLSPFSQRPKQMQVAALCYRGKGREKEVLMITSRGTGRWIIPKGWPMRGKDSSTAALQEAWEEAGVRNSRAKPEPIGSYTYDKVKNSGVSVPVEAFVYPVAVKDLADDFPEADERKRKWMRPADAAKAVQEPELKQILRALS